MDQGSSEISGKELTKILRGCLEPCPPDQMIGQDPEKENIDETVQDSNKGQTFSFVEEKAHN